MAKIGIFDSGIGGEAIAGKLRSAFPLYEILVVSDRANLPYGERRAGEIRDLTDTAVQPLLKAGCDVIVIACNTATAHAISFLRQKYPDTSFVGIEPMLKDAARASKTRKIAVCATPATLKSRSYQKLKKTWAADIVVLEPDCSSWASLIDNNSMGKNHIDAVVSPLIEQKVDIIVLGCTHYHWIKDEIVDLAAGKAVILEPSQAIVARVRAVMQSVSKEPLLPA